jgi:RHS repeat-associated protein
MHLFRGVEYRKDSNGIKWYLYDGLGSVVGEVDEDGDVTYAAKYDVYGAVRGSTGSSNSQHKFCGSLGHMTEGDTGGLIYMRARWMDPVTGRFVSEDPAGDGVNWYAYCDNNPINRYDYDGCEWNQDKWTGKGGKWIRLDSPHGQGQYHLHWGQHGNKWGAINADMTSHDGKILKAMDDEMMQAVKRSKKLKRLGFANDSLTAAWQADPLFVIGLFLDLMGQHDKAAQVDRLNGYLN